MYISRKPKFANFGNEDYINVEHVVRITAFFSNIKIR